MGRTRRPQLSRGSERFKPPIVGALELSFKVLELPHTGLTVYGRVAEVGSGPEEKLRLLAYWTRPQHAREPGSANTSPEQEALTLTPGGARSILPAGAPPRGGTPPQRTRRRHGARPRPHRPQHL